MKKIFFSIVVILFILIIYRGWIFSESYTGGDANYLFRSMYGNYPFYPSAWDFNAHYGLGGNSLASLSNVLLTKLPINILGTILGLSWGYVEKIGAVLPFIIVGFFAPFVFFKRFFGRSFGIVSSLLFLVNTYILMVVGGGLINLGIAYALVPFVILYFIYLLEPNYKSVNIGIIFGILLSILILIDLRFAYIALVACWIYVVITVVSKGLDKSYLSKSFFLKLFFAGIIPFLLCLQWIIPLKAVGQNPLSELGSNYISTSSVAFFSFAKYEHALSLVQPNWPENVFGKTTFLNPIFLIYPLLAFAALFFISRMRGKNAKLQKKVILFLITCSLVGVFFSKGSQDPFGGIYLWLFKHIPGFIMFRDPTKWYSLTAFSYALLIPFTLREVVTIIDEKIHPEKFAEIIKVLGAISLGIIFLLLYLPGISGQLSGTFQNKPLPVDYSKLEVFLRTQKEYSRVLWVPRIQRFGYTSHDHPAISAQEFYQIADSSELLSKIADESSYTLFSEAAVKYVVVPFDSEKEIYITDRKFDGNLEPRYIDSLSQLPWLKRLPNIGKIAIFEVQNSKKHIWSRSKTSRIEERYVSPVQYKLKITNAQKGERIIFAETYDPGWVVEDGITFLESKPYSKFNSFTLIKSGNYDLNLRYGLQKWVDIGLFIFAGVSGLLAFYGIWQFVVWIRKMR